jgi:alkylation response protein AidB-like acyl-CoA dehydrogenase
MALVLNEEQTMLKDAAHDFLQERAPISLEMGWTAIVVPEEHGGLDYGYTGLGIVLEESGRTLTPSPLLGTALTGVAALTRGGTTEQCSAILPGVISGEQLLSLACDEGSAHDPGRVDTAAESDGAGYRLTGRKMAALDGHVADTFIVSGRTADGISLFLVPADAAGVTVEAYPELDIHRAANVTFDGVELSAGSLLGGAGAGSELLDRILDAARIGVSAELLGIAQEAFGRTVEYLKERKQFGVPIGSFQALQHRAALLFGEIEMCKSLVLKALQTLDESEENNPELASMTKAKLSETAHRASAEAIQMHGGIGVTDDFDIGFFLKRCRILEALYGDRYFHLDRYARIRGY